MEVGWGMGVGRGIYIRLQLPYISPRLPMTDEGKN